jgi:hypothetical protein
MRSTYSLTACTIQPVPDDDEQRLIDAYLAPFDSETDEHSAFELALRDARAATLRSQDDGRPLRPDHSTSWLGTVGYLVLLDQLGETLRPAGEAPGIWPPKTPTVRRCLGRFAPDLSDDDTAAIYGLRCALAHDFGLWNPPPAEGPAEPWHRIFTLVADDTTALIDQPARQWDGSLPVGNAPFDMATTVNLRRLVGRIEKLVTEVRERSRHRGLEIALENPIDLVFRFRVRVFDI